MNEIGLALRSELYEPDEIIEFVKIADNSKQITHVFFPDIPYSQESIELSAAGLALTKRVKVGSGVIRLLEYDPTVLRRRLQTIQYMSQNRFILGIGTGGAGPYPAQTIEAMLGRLDETKEGFATKMNHLEIKIPEVLIASLRLHIAQKSINHADGLLLNFCTPEYAGTLIGESRKVSEEGSEKIFACYVKIFYSKEQTIANRLLLEEFVKYDRIPQYHAMFEKQSKGNVVDSISAARSNLSNAGSMSVPESLMKISLANPTRQELRELVQRFRATGVTLPCIYPYFRLEEGHSFKASIVKEIASLDPQ